MAGSAEIGATPQKYPILQLANLTDNNVIWYKNYSSEQLGFEPADFQMSPMNEKYLVMSLASSSIKEVRATVIDNEN